MNSNQNKPLSSNNCHSIESDDIEYFDVVNVNDEVIGRLPRDEVHDKGLLHRAVHALIFSADSAQVLIQKRAADKQHEPNCWDTSVGGHVSSGETYDQAIHRESIEEMGIDLTENQMHPLFKLRLDEGVDDEFVWVYVIYTDEPVTPCVREVAQIKWLSPESFLDFVSNEKESCSVTLKAIVARMLTDNCFLKTP